MTCNLVYKLVGLFGFSFFGFAQNRKLSMVLIVVNTFYGAHCGGIQLFCFIKYAFSL